MEDNWPLLQGLSEATFEHKDRIDAPRLAKVHHLKGFQSFSVATEISSASFIFIKPRKFFYLDLTPSVPEDSTQGTPTRDLSIDLLTARLKSTAWVTEFQSFHPFKTPKLACNSLTDSTQVRHLEVSLKSPQLFKLLSNNLQMTFLKASSYQISHLKLFHHFSWRWQVAPFNLLFKICVKKSIFSLTVQKIKAKEGRTDLFIQSNTKIVLASSLICKASAPAEMRATSHLYLIGFYFHQIYQQFKGQISQ